MDVSSLSSCRVKVSWTETKGEHRKMLKKHLWGFDAGWNSFLVEARPYKKKSQRRLPDYHQMYVGNICTCLISGVFHVETVVV